jgi:adenosylcobinamide kinase/adenosylcobinamide-phosphate guanylyltransferase
LAPLPRTTLVLGGARSGKSGYAEALALADGRAAVYVATAVAFDDEMKARIARHRDERHRRFITVEAPTDLAGVLARQAAAERVVLVDCVTVWLGNLLHDGRDPDAASLELIERLQTLPGATVIVSNEVGLGIVPENRLARLFRDAQGRLNQGLAAIAGRVVFVAAGLPMIMKG